MQKCYKASMYLLIAGASFFAGFKAKEALTSAPGDLQARIESIVSKEPTDYHDLARHSREFWHQTMAASVPSARNGYVSFNDVRIVTRPEGDQSITVLVNKNTNQAQPVLYIDGKMAVGSYQDRFASVKQETFDQGKDIVVNAKQEVKSLKDKAVDKLNRWYDRFNDLWSNNEVESATLEKT